MVVHVPNIFVTTDLVLSQVAIQVLRNAVGGGRVSGFLEKSITKMYGSKLLTLEGGGWVSNFQKKALRNT